MRIAIGCDHIVTDIKDKMVTFLKSEGHEVHDCGTHDFERTHYPIYGLRVAQKVLNKEVDKGIVICGTGVGITVAATKIKGIRTVLTRDPMVAKVACERYNTNVLGMGGRIVGLGLMEEIIKTFLAANYVSGAEEEVKILDGLLSAKIPQERQFDAYLKKWDNGEYHD